MRVAPLHGRWHAALALLVLSACTAEDPDPTLGFVPYQGGEMPDDVPPLPDDGLPPEPPTVPGFGLAPAYLYNTSTWMAAAAIGDVTGDGLADVVFGALGNSTDLGPELQVFEQKASGGLSWPPQIIPYRNPVPDNLCGGSCTGWSLGLTLADMNQDGIKDIVVGHQRGLSIITSLGGGDFGAPVYEFPVLLPFSQRPFGVIDTMDVNRDGFPDIVSGCARHPAICGDNIVTVYLGDGEGGISERVQYPSMPNGHGVTLVDLSGDGIKDLIATLCGPSVRTCYYPHNGVDGFSSEWVIIDADRQWMFSTAIDFNSDGKRDFVGTLHLAGQDTFWAATQEAGGFEGIAFASGGPSPEEIKSGDMNNDGIEDFVIAQGGYTTVSAFISDGASSFTTISQGIPYATFYPMTSLAVGDYTNDGCDDIAIADSNNGAVFVESLCPTDVDEDGVIDALDNCPAAVNPLQADEDDDSVGDACDKCLGVPSPGNPDLDGDGMGDECDLDMDGDGADNELELALGMDPRGLDSDGDFIPDAVEFLPGMAENTDGDNVVDAADRDSDNDGLSDTEEAGDEDVTTPPLDTDFDGTPDYRDRDSDGDGEFDLDDACPRDNRNLCDFDPWAADAGVSPPRPAPPSGCGCRTSGSSGGIGFGVLFLLWWRRRTPSWG